MATIKSVALADLDWVALAASLERQGYAMLPKLLSASQSSGLAARATDLDSPSQRISLESLGCGRGDLFGLPHPLPDPLESWRETFYCRLAPIADRWSEMMGDGSRYPATLDNYENRSVSRPCLQTTLRRLDAGDYQALHQSEDTVPVFPLKLVMLLSEPGRDFAGGEFVMVEERRRQQSRAVVFPLRLGDGILVPTSYRPSKGRRNYYRTRLKYAISPIDRGNRIDLVMLFHEARGRSANDPSKIVDAHRP